MEQPAPSPTWHPAPSPGESHDSHVTGHVISHREELAAAEVVPALVLCLGFTEVKVQKSAADALAAMATDSSARVQFLSSGGVASSLPLLQSTDHALLTSALCLVRAVGQSTTVAQEFCGAGSVLTPSPISHPPLISHSALELLTQLSKTGHAPSSVGPALQQLLNSDLSAKWWTQGHLDTRNIITNIEFFDPGPVRHYITITSLCITSSCITSS